MDGKSTFGTRPAIDIHMLNEIIARELKHFRNYKTYRPNFGSVPVTTKFYARQDQIETETGKDKERVDQYESKVAQTRSKGPAAKFPEPVTENMVYGWYNTPIIRMDRNDKRFYHPKRESSHTKVEVIIYMSKPKPKAKK